MATAGSLFGQLLHHIPRVDMARLVKEHGAERHAKGFTCWNQLVAMLFCHLAQADSLREICNGLSCCLGKLVHLGLGRAPKRSTLSYANEHRPAALYEAVFWTVLQRFRGQGALGGRRTAFRFKNNLLSLDSTTVSLCLGLFPWADFRRAKGGVKVHVLLDHADYMPRFVLITEARRHDLVAARALDLAAGSVVAMDKAYNDFRLFARWTEAGVFFVTRLKDNAVFHVIEDRPRPKNRPILADQIIRLAGAGAADKCPHLLRRVVVWDAENERAIVLLTNHRGFGATTIADIYQQRWQIELFFKALKQNLKIKTFVGTSENALRIQIWTALIVLLLLKWLHHLSRAGWSLSNLAALLRMNLFTYRDLAAWIDDPFGTPPQIPQPHQLVLALPGFGQPTTLPTPPTSTQFPPRPAAKPA
jgi:hypothetical protein